MMTISFAILKKKKYISFSFRKLENFDKLQREKSPFVKIEFGNSESNDVTFRNCGSANDSDSDDEVAICDNYAHHGHCPAGHECPQSHDILRIVQQNGSRKRKSNGTPASNETKKHKSGKVMSDGHRAGFDAFMTAYTFAAISCSSSSTQDNVNKIYLATKDFPLILQKSSFAKKSASHMKKMQRLTNKSS